MKACFFLKNIRNLLYMENNDQFCKSDLNLVAEKEIHDYIVMKNYIYFIEIVF